MTGTEHAPTRSWSTCSHDYCQMLRAAGLRVTEPRVAVIEALLSADDHPNAEMLLARVRKHDETISLATVYRTLSVLEQAELVRRIWLESSPARYEMAPGREHDHLIDIDTGDIVEFSASEIARICSDFAARLGYEIVSQQTIVKAKRLENSKMRR